MLQSVLNNGKLFREHCRVHWIGIRQTFVVSQSQKIIDTFVRDTAFWTFPT